MKIQDSIALVTGSNRGIGKAHVEELIKLGVKKVYAAARNTDTLNDMVDKYKGKVVAIQLDVTNDDQIKAAAENASDVSILINNAGIAEMNGLISADSLDGAVREMETNYFGLLKVTRAFASILGKNKESAIVNISSVAGLVNMPVIGSYSATKAAVHSLTQGIRGELASQGTHVVGVYPGPIETDMAKGFDMPKETPNNVALEVLGAIENKVEEVYPDPMSKDTHKQLLADAKVVEKGFSQMLPQ